MSCPHNSSHLQMSSYLRPICGPPGHKTTKRVTDAAFRFEFQAGFDVGTARRIGLVSFFLESFGVFSLRRGHVYVPVPVVKTYWQNFSVIRNCVGRVRHVDNLDHMHESFGCVFCTGRFIPQRFDVEKTQRPSRSRGQSDRRCWRKG